MKPIEQEYNGIKYRSKTEAKWALFMDLIGCPYIYEPEGYDLGHSIYYCPDFYLPRVDMFLEIKPMTGGHASPTKLFAEKSGKRIVTMYGSPDDCNPNNGWIELGYCDFPEGGEDHCYWFCLCPRCKIAGIEFDGRSDRLPCRCKKSAHGDKGYNSDAPLLLYAYKATKQAFRWNKP